MEDRKNDVVRFHESCRTEQTETEAESSVRPKLRPKRKREKRKEKREKQARLFESSGFDSLSWKSEETMRRSAVALFA